MKNYLCLLAFLFLSGGTVLQAQSFSWATGVDGYGLWNRMALGQNSDVYSIGNFIGTVDLDPGPGLNQHTQTGNSTGAYFTRQDSSGNLIWGNSLSNDIRYLGEIAVDSMGSMYIVGNFEGTVDFDPGPGTYNVTGGIYSNPFVLKLDSMGNFVWVQVLNSTNINDYPLSVAVGPSGSIYVTGRVSDPMDFDPGPGTYTFQSNGNSSFFVLKLHATGSFDRLIALPNGTSYPSGMVLDEDENIFLVGGFLGVTDFDPGPGTNNLSANASHDGFLLKLDSIGNLVWGHVTETEFVEDIHLDQFGNILIAGYFGDSTDFDHGPGLSSYVPTGISHDAFLMKLTTTGQFRWVAPLPGSYRNTPRIVRTDRFGSVYSVGSFQGNVDLDPGIGQASYTALSINRRAYVLKLDSSGIFDYAKVMTDTSYTHLSGLEIDAEDDLYFCGHLQEDIDLDPGTGVFVLPVNTFFRSFTGKWTQNLCSVDTSLTFSMGYPSAAMVNAQYQWLDCDSGMVPIAGETGQTFAGASQLSYNVAVEINYRGCIDTSACVNVVVVGVSEADWGVRVYPNPTTGQVTIDLGSDIGTAEVQFSDVQGRVLHTTRIEGSMNSRMQLDMKSLGLTAGIYFARVEAEGRSRIFKLVLTE